MRALRQANQPRPLTPAEYLRFLTQVKVTTDQLRSRPIFKGDPFTLPAS